jgi:uncharacterized membrane protein
MTIHNDDPWGGDGPTKLRQRFVAETEQLIDRKLKRAEQLLADAEREETDINEAREMLRLLKTKSPNGYVPEAAREVVERRLAKRTPKPGKSKSRRSQADTMRLIRENFEGEFSTRDFTAISGLSPNGVSTALLRLVKAGRIEQVKRGEGKRPSVWRHLPQSATDEG